MTFCECFYDIIKLVCKYGFNTETLLTVPLGQGKCITEWETEIYKMLHMCGQL